MILSLIVESKNFEDDADMQEQINKNPCDLCILGQGPMCFDVQYCRWKTHKEIYIKVDTEVLDED